jgi:hypothetical protein
MSMNDHELERFEAELRGTGAARPPEDFMQRLKSEVPALVAERRAQKELAALERRVEEPVRPEAARAPERGVCPSWLPLILRWVAPAVAVLVVGVIVWRANLPGEHRPQTASAPVRADDVRIDQELVSTYDTVATLPSGEPVRFRCREWMDEVVLRDSRRGVEVARRVPRVEVVPVRFETY